MDSIFSAIVGRDVTYDSGIGSKWDFGKRRVMGAHSAEERNQGESSDELLSGPRMYCMTMMNDEFF